MLVNVNNLEEEYNALFRKLSDRKEQIMKFKSFLESETCWLTSPASTKFHLNIEKGLLIHSVSVTPRNSDWFYVSAIKRSQDVLE